MAGSGGSGPESASDVIASLQNLFNLYSQVEPNQKVKQTTEQMYSVLRDRLSEGSIHPVTLQILRPMVQAAEQNNLAAAQNLHKELVQKCWQECKDWANGLKILISFKQRFQ
jgi:uncharacterized protein (DUF2267 family)